MGGFLSAAHAFLAPMGGFLSAAHAFLAPMGGFLSAAHALLAPMHTSILYAHARIPHLPACAHRERSCISAAAPVRERKESMHPRNARVAT
jgi:hypothetical protein